MRISRCESDVMSDESLLMLCSDESAGYQGSKERGRAWLQAAQQRIEKARSIAVIGGGALGVRKS